MRKRLLFPVIAAACLAVIFEAKAVESDGGWPLLTESENGMRFEAKRGSLIVAGDNIALLYRVSMPSKKSNYSFGYYVVKKDHCMMGAGSLRMMDLDFANEKGRVDFVLDGGTISSTVAGVMCALAKNHE
jgi:hypothetical protein